MFPIRVSNVSKAYKLYSTPADRLKEAIWRGRKTYHDLFWALRDVSFEVPKGTTIGVIGRNGSGKSTLLQIIAGILQPTDGAVAVEGRVAALLELGSGFDPEFTGRENVFMNASILGLSEDEIKERFTEIEAFAGIGAFMDQPVKKYSSGMFVRLAFATAVNVDPDILLVDEALAVGDVVFQHRCMAKIRKFQEEGKTIFFVSHDLGAVAKLCEQAILMDGGRMLMMDKPSEVIHEYYKLVVSGDDDHGDEISGIQLSSSDVREMCLHMKPVVNYDGRIGGVNGEIVSYFLADGSGRERVSFYGGDTVSFQILIRCKSTVDIPVAGISVKDLYGSEILRSNSDIAGAYIGEIKAGAEALITFEFVLPYLKKGSYSVSVGFGSGTTDNCLMFDYIENITVFEVENNGVCLGMLDIPLTVNFGLLS